MKWDDDKEIAHRVAEISSISYEEALGDLRRGGRPRELLVMMVRGNEETRRLLEQIDGVLRKMRAA